MNVKQKEHSQNKKRMKMPNYCQALVCEVVICSAVASEQIVTKA